MDNVFSFRDRLVAEYSGFTRIAADDILRVVEQEYAAGLFLLFGSSGHFIR